MRRSNREHLLNRQLGGAISLSFGHPSHRDLVCVGSKKQMIRVNTGWGAAAMKDLHSRWNWTNGHFVR